MPRGPTKKLRKFVFRVFFHQEWLANQTKKFNLPYYFPVSRRRDEIMPFSKGISAQWNTNSFVQDLNPGHWFKEMSIVGLSFIKISLVKDKARNLECPVRFDFNLISESL